MKPTISAISRRRFIKDGTRGAGLLLALSGAGIAAARAGDKSPSPFAYDIGPLAKTDPNLLKYDEVGRFQCANPEPRRIAVGPDGRVFIAHRDGLSKIGRAHV